MGVTLLTVAVYVNPLVSVTLPPGCCTTTFTTPAPAGVVTLMLVGLVTENAVPATPPNVTPVAPVSPVPVTVTGVPPAAGPVLGLTPVTVGV